MTQEQARAEAQRRNADPAAAGFWAAQRTPVGTWRVVRVLGPDVERKRPTRAHARGAPHAPHPADARVGPVGDVPPVAGP